MKIVELTNKILLPITNEETALLQKFTDSAVPKSELTEREMIIAHHLTVKEVLTRTNEHGTIYYKKRIKQI